MRTDGLQMSAEAIQEIRVTVQGMLGPEYLPAEPRIYKCDTSHCSSLIYTDILWLEDCTLLSSVETLCRRGCSAPVSTLEK